VYASHKFNYRRYKKWTIIKFLKFYNPFGRGAGLEKIMGACHPFFEYHVTRARGAEGAEGDQPYSKTPLPRRPP